MTKLSRRDFLKLSLTAGLIAGSLSLIDWKRAVARAVSAIRSQKIHIVWIESQDCAGDTIALLDASEPELLEVLLGSITAAVPPAKAPVLSWHQTVMPQWGVKVDGRPQMFVGFAAPVVIINELLKTLKAVGPEAIERLTVKDVLKVVEDFSARLETEGVRIPTILAPVRIPAEMTKALIMEIVEDIVRIHRVPLEQIPKVLADIVRSLGPITDVLDGYALTWPFESVEVLKLAERGKLDPFVLVIEGAIPAGEILEGVPGWYSMVGSEDERPIMCTEWIIRLARRAVAVLCVGTCASYGGFSSNKVIEVEQVRPEYMRLYERWLGSKAPTGSIGFFPDPVKGTIGLLDLPERVPPEALKPEVREIYRDALMPYYKFFRLKMAPTWPLHPDAEVKPCIAVPGCPASGDAILKTAALLVLAVALDMPGLIPELDEYGRPKFLFARTLHEQCPRAGAYAAGEFRVEPGQSEPEHGWKCLFSVGCKGPVVNCPYGGGKPLGWIRGLAGCVRQGAVCIGCTMPGFSDAFEPLYKPLPSPTPPGITATAAIGIGAFAAGLAVAGAVTRYVKKRAERETR